MKRKIEKIFLAQKTLEGAGVRLHRGFGYNEVPLFDPFLLLDDFGSDNPEDYLAGFPWHPHRGIETITYILEGSVAHEDSLGNKGVIGKGDVQWMTAGSGIIHQEMPQKYDGTSRGFQLWLNLPKKHKMRTPHYRGITSEMIPSVNEDGATIKVLSGNYKNVEGPVTDAVVKNFYLDVSLSEGNTFSYKTESDFTVLIYVVSGSLVLEEDTIPHDRIVVLTKKGTEIEVIAKSPETRFLLMGGMPINEPVAWHGPIVMNTQEELDVAFREYSEGTFIKHKPE